MLMAVDREGERRRYEPSTHVPVTTTLVKQQSHTQDTKYKECGLGMGWGIEGADGVDEPSACVPTLCALQN